MFAYAMPPQVVTLLKTMHQLADEKTKILVGYEQHNPESAHAFYVHVNQYFDTESVCVPTRTSTNACQLLIGIRVCCVSCVCVLCVVCVCVSSIVTIDPAEPAR
jgi:hypothetical protein